MIESSARWAITNTHARTREQRDYLGKLVMPRTIRAAQPDLVVALKHLRAACEAFESAEKAIAKKVKP
jgi:hypothetical protein